MSIQNQIERLTSQSSHEVEEAMHFFTDFFYNDLPISGEDYVAFITTSVDRITQKDFRGFDTDLIAMISHSLYSDGGKIIDADSFDQAIQYIANTNNAAFAEVLEPLAGHPRLGKTIEVYLENIGSHS